MDDLILAGALSLAGLYAAAILAAGAVLFTGAGLFSAASAGDAGRAAVIIALVFLFLAAYAVTGLWLQKTGRI